MIYTITVSVYTESGYSCTSDLDAISSKDLGSGGIMEHLERLGEEIIEESREVSYYVFTATDERERKTEFTIDCEGKK